MSARYLGTDLGNSRQCFGANKKGRLMLAEKIGKFSVFCCVQVV